MRMCNVDDEIHSWKVLYQIFNLFFVFTNFLTFFTIKIKATRFHLFKNLKLRESFNQQLWRYLEIFQQCSLHIDVDTMINMKARLLIFFLLSTKKLVRWLAANGADWTGRREEKIESVQIFSKNLWLNDNTSNTRKQRKKTAEKSKWPKIYWQFCVSQFLRW